MQESFICYLWKNQYFNKQKLFTNKGEELHIIHPGFENYNAGPDFNHAKLLINGLLWHGQVEVHVNASDWYLHNHNKDKGYNGVVLHVVWDFDKETLREDGSEVTVLPLKQYVSKKQLKRYLTFKHANNTIACTSSLKHIAPLYLYSMLDKVLLERIVRKSLFIKQLFHASNYHWEKALYLSLMYNWGQKINKDPFLRLGKSLSLKIIQKNKNSVFKIEAMLFGIAGFLEHPSGDSYYQALKKEYDHLSRKYNFSKQIIDKSEWKFLRLRPHNFPTIRIAQIAALLAHSPRFFDKLLHLKSLEEAYSFFKVEPSLYWQTHYHFEKTTNQKSAFVGESWIHSLLINTLVPFWVCYGDYVDNQYYVEQAIKLLESIPVEKNHIVKKWHSIGITPQHAFDSQALLELYHEYCEKNRCLSCKIGVKLMQE